MGTDSHSSGSQAGSINAGRGGSEGTVRREGTPALHGELLLAQAAVTLRDVQLAWLDLLVTEVWDYF